MERAASLPKPSELIRPYFEAKQKRVPSYSLRRLGRDLGVSPGYVSQVLSGKRVPSAKLILKIRDALGIEFTDFSLLEKSVAVYGTAGLRKKELLQDFMKSAPGVLTQVEHEKGEFAALEVMKSWAHFAFLDLTTCADFSSDERWIARRLGIGLLELRQVISDLVLAGLVRKVDGKWQKTQKRVQFPTDRTHPATRQYHNQMIQKALDVMNSQLTEDEVARRRIIGATLAVDSSKIEEFVSMLNEFLFAAVERLGGERCDQVYQLSFQLVPLTNSEKEAMSGRKSSLNGGVK